MARDASRCRSTRDFVPPWRTDERHGSTDAICPACAGPISPDGTSRLPACVTWTRGSARRRTVGGDVAHRHGRLRVPAGWAPSGRPTPAASLVRHLRSGCAPRRYLARPCGRIRAAHREDLPATRDTCACPPRAGRRAWLAPRGRPRRADHDAGRRSVGPDSQPSAAWTADLEDLGRDAVRTPRRDPTTT